MGGSAYNPTNTAPNVEQIKSRVGVSVLDNTITIPNFCRHQVRRVMDVTHDAVRVYKPGEPIRLVFPSIDFNPMRSYLEFDLEVMPIECYDSLVTVAGRAREHFRKTMPSRPGVTFAQLPGPVHNIQRARFNIDIDLGLTALAATTTATPIRTVFYDGEIKSPFAEKWNSYLAGTNVLLRDNFRLGSHYNAIGGNYNLSGATDAADTKLLTENVPFNIPFGGYLSLSQLVGAEANRSQWTDMAYSAATADFDVRLANATRTWTADNHGLPYQILSEPGSVLNARYRESVMNPGRDPKVHVEYLSQSVITPDEALASWDPYGYAQDTRILKNDAHGIFMRNIFGLFRDFSVGTNTDSAYICREENCQDTMLLRSLHFENDSLKHSNVVWGTSHIPTLFDWRRPTNMDLVSYAQDTNVTSAFGDGTALIQTSDTQGLTNMINKDRRVYNSALNIYPFYREKLVIPVKIPLPFFTDFFSDEFIPAEILADNLTLSITLQNLGQAFDYGKTDGFSLDTGETVVDTLSFGNAYNFIRNVLGVQNWQGWQLSNLRFYLDQLDFHGDGNGGLGRSMKLERYHSMYAEGAVSRSYYVFNTLRAMNGGDTPANQITAGVAGLGSEYTKTISLSANSGVIAAIVFTHKLDGVNSGVVPFHDSCSLEFGSNVDWRMPSNQNTRLSLDDQLDYVLDFFNKDYSHITNPCSDLVWRFGNNANRRMHMMCEYLYSDSQPELIGLPNVKTGIHGYNTWYSNLGAADQYSQFPTIPGVNDAIEYNNATITYGNITQNVDIMRGTPMDLSYIYNEGGGDYHFGTGNSTIGFDYYNAGEITSSGNLTVNESSSALQNTVTAPRYESAAAQYTERNGQINNRYDPYRVYSQSNVFQPKKISYHDTCFGIWDLRGDGPTPGSTPGAIFQGFETSVNQQNTLTIEYNVHDASLRHRFRDRTFIHQVTLIQDRVVYYVPTPDGTHIGLMRETNPGAISEAAAPGLN